MRRLAPIAITVGIFGSIAAYNVMQFISDENTEKAKKNLISATVDIGNDTNKVINKVTDIYTDAVGEGSMWKWNRAGKTDEFREVCTENGIKMKPYVADNDTVIKYDDKTLMINGAALITNKEDVIKEKVVLAVEMVKADPNSTFALKIK